ncbi:unnamed protein product, partial [Rotaria magnacalcarata]
SANMPAVSDRESHAIADIELCGERYGKSFFELCKPLDMVGEWPDFFAADNNDGSLALGSSKAA